ncbi:PrpF protein [Prauserella sp. PE36]|uniref:2-methylaconitate cis-trans isomerase PrpF family protein n=1 Tax=Prauserella sp. PE36 TaxID=1504709 RepID=UPI000D987480|nr:PrpF domain-containing protein [Prauserella sp. PE36]PXY23209.1 PrpF protein [Prauserella coralliicola]RBM18801.1 PrpF protein [Prauserella sp. PE36]
MTTANVVPDQLTVRCVLMRGGTSKGLYFHEADLPAPGAGRDAVLARVMGSPDPLQIDGLGGSRPITSKLAIVARSERADADVDYTFGQVEIERAAVVYSGNCGNISAGVGPFAIDEGLVTAAEGVTPVRIHNTNTGVVMTAYVPVQAGKARVLGDFAIPGVPGTGAEIVMDWARTVGAKTGALLPTGRAVDDIVLESGSVVRATICDVGNPCVWIPAADVGLDGSELADRIDGDSALVDAVREIRGKAAVRIGLCADWRSVDDQSPGLPMVGLVAAPAGYRTLSGTVSEGGDMDLRVRLIFMNRLHESIAGTASVCLAAASRVSGSVVSAVATQRRRDTILIGHPSGITPARVTAHAIRRPPYVSFDLLGFSRTARRLMDCAAYYPYPAP